MKESNFKKTKLASVLLLSTVLLPNIAYAEEENDEVENAEHLEVQLFNELSSDSDENQPILNDDSNTDIEMDDSIQEEPESDDAEELLIPAVPDEEFEEVIDETEEDESVDSGESTEGEEETPTGATPEITNPEMNVPDAGEGETLEPEIPEIPIEPIEPIDPVEPEIPVEPTEPEVPVEPESPVEPEVPVEPTEPQLPYEPEEPFELEIPGQEEPFEPEVPDNDENEEYVEETEPSTEEETTGTGSGPKKLYRYNHGDILSGINFDSRNIENDMATLDQRVTRVMSSEIIEEKDLTEEQKLEMKEDASKTTPHGAEELPDTGETHKIDYAVIGMLSIIGGIMLLLSKKVKTDN